MYRFTTDFPKKKPFVFESYEPICANAIKDFIKLFALETKATPVNLYGQPINFLNGPIDDLEKQTITQRCKKSTSVQDKVANVTFNVNITIEKIDDADNIDVATEEYQKYAKFIDNLNELIEKIEELACQLYALDTPDFVKEDCYDNITDSQNALKRVREKMING